MDDYFSYLLNNFSIDVFLLALGVFFATMIIKIPIKKATKNLHEAKRQGMNSLIILIPLVLSFLAVLVYFVCLNREIISLTYISFSISTCIMAIAVYSIYSRVVIIFKGIMSGKMQLNEKTVENVIDELDNMVKETKREELSEIRNKIVSLINFRQQLKDSGTIQNITAIEETNQEIQKLELKKQQLISNN